MITFKEAVNTLVGLHYFAEKFQKIIQPYTIKIEKENVIVYKNSIEKIKEELKTAINNYKKANKTHNKFILQTEQNNEKYIFKIHQIENDEITKTHTFNTTLTEKEIRQYKVNAVKHLSLIDLLKNTNHENEIQNFYNEFVKQEVDNTLDESWLDISDFLKENSIYNYKQKEINHFKSLNEEEKHIFAYANAYTYVDMLLTRPLNYLFEHYNLEYINIAFEEIEFVED